MTQIAPILLSQRQRSWTHNRLLIADGAGQQGARLKLLAGLAGDVLSADRLKELSDILSQEIRSGLQGSREI